MRLVVWVGWLWCTRVSIDRFRAAQAPTVGRIHRYIAERKPSRPSRLPADEVAGWKATSSPPWWRTGHRTTGGGSTRRGSVRSRGCSPTATASSPPAG